jgi:hypothetical protein
MKLGMPQQVARVVARDEAKRPTVRINFSKRTLDGLEPPRSGDRRWGYDAKVPGLALMVTATGRKTFYLYKKVDGQPQRVRIGDFPTVTINQARSAAGKLIGEIAAGGDPQGRRREKRTEQTLGALFDGWLNQYAKVHLRTWAESERIFKCYLEPWRNRRLSTITRANVSALHAKVGAAGKAPYQANRLLALLRTLWNWHNGDKHTGTNPARGIRRFDEQERERFLAGDELGSFLTALEEEQSENSAIL